MLPDSVIVEEVRTALRSIAEGHASIASAGESCIRALFEQQQLQAAHRDPEQDDDEGVLPAEPPRLMPATATGD